MTSYLDPLAVSRLANMQIRARTIVEGFYAGMHKSPLKGRSTDFADYRRYAQGDDLKHIDWKVYAKANRYYIKEFEEQTSLSANLLVDCSASMAYGSQHVSKLQYACYLAGALMYLVTKQQDSAGLYTFHDAVHGEFPPRRNSSHLQLMLDHLDQLIPAGSSRIAAVLEQLAGRIKRRGLVIVISDLMDEPPAIVAALQALRGRRNEVVVLQVLDRDELEFPFDQLMEFEDLETGAVKKIDCEAVRRAYLERLREFLSYYENECPRAGIDYVRVNTHEPFHAPLNRYLVQRQAAVRR